MEPTAVGSKKKSAACCSRSGKPARQHYELRPRSRCGCRFAAKSGGRAFRRRPAQDILFARHRSPHRSARRRWRRPHPNLPLSSMAISNLSFRHATEGSNEESAFDLAALTLPNMGTTTEGAPCLASFARRGDFAESSPTKCGIGDRSMKKVYEIGRIQENSNLVASISPGSRLILRTALDCSPQRVRSFLPQVRALSITHPQPHSPLK